MSKVRSLVSLPGIFHLAFNNLDNRKDFSCSAWKSAEFDIELFSITRNYLLKVYGCKNGAKVCGCEQKGASFKYCN